MANPICLALHAVEVEFTMFRSFVFDSSNYSVSVTPLNDVYQQRAVQSHLRARFAVENCQLALEEFERQYPVSFALELDLEEDKSAGSTAKSQKPSMELAVRRMSASRAKPRSISNTDTPLMPWRGSQVQNALGLPTQRQSISSRLTARRQSAASSASSRSRGSFTSIRTIEKTQKKSTKKTEKQQAAPISDEADTYKKIRRQIAYRECSRHFTRYFSEAGTHSQLFLA